jgi:elongation factor Ts
MSEFTAKDVAALRKASGAGMMDAKRALEEAGGDIEAAKEILLEKGIADARKRAGRTADEGAVGHYLHFQADRPVIGVLVDLAAETDFVAKSEEFQQAARDIAMHVAAAKPRWVRREDVPESIVTEESEIFATQARNDGKPENVIDRIVEGRMRAFLEETVLYEQPFVNPERFDGTVGALVESLAASMGENVGVRRFERVAIGERSE